MEKNETPGALNPAHVLAKKLQENRKTLHIARIPDKTKGEFIDLAMREFCGDYGMALKWLMDDIPNQDIRMIIAKLEEQEMRIQALESATGTSKETPDEDSRKMLDGSSKIVRRPKKNE